MSRRLLPTRALVVTILLPACGGGGQVVVLDPGREVRIEADGSLTLRVDGRDVFATAPGHSPTVHAYDFVFDQALGFYDIRREGEVAVPATRVVRVESVGTRIEVEWASDAGTRVRAQVSDGPAADTTRVRFSVLAAPAGHDSLAVPLRCDTEASFFGFGEQYNALDQRGEAFPLLTSEQGIGRGGFLWLIEGDAHTTYLPMPYFLDARGFGAAIETDARVLVDLCQTNPDAAWFDVEQAQPADFVVFHGPTPKDVVRQVGDVYGRPSALEDWALGPWIGIQGGQQAVLDEADALDAASVPYTALWAQDWVGRRDFSMNQVGVRYHWTADTTLYPDLAGMVTTLHGRGKRFLAYANPWVVEPENHFADMEAAGLLIENAAGATYRMVAPSTQQSSLPDLTLAATHAYIAGFLDAMVTTYGIDGWMCDFGEALPLDAVVSDGTPGVLAHNRFPILWTALNHERLREQRPTGDYALFSRSGWLGSQGQAHIVWIGDQEANDTATDGLPTVVPALLNLGLSGVPFVTHDIAGFSGGPSTFELYRRWTELGAFTTIFRTHEGLRRNENWNWNGSPTADPTDVAASIAHFRRFARIHEALVPYLAGLVDEAAATSVPPMRAMLLEFPDDADARAVEDQFMVGDKLLVAPVVTMGTTSREVYFPAGTYTHALRPTETYVGPRRVVVDAPLGEPPVFWRGTPVVDLSAVP